jgi:HAMP domain-containing protein
MTIRSRLLFLLLPTLTALVAMIALFFYFNWSHEITHGFKMRLQSIVAATAQSLHPEEIEWISQNLKDPNLTSQPRFIRNRDRILKIKEQLPPVDNLYVVRIEPMQANDLADLKQSSKEQTTQGVDPDYKQIFLLDASFGQAINAPGDIDYSETGEQKVYSTKKSFVTPIYKARKSSERFLSAYAPILNDKGDVIALLGADVSMLEIDQKLQHALLAVFVSTLIALLLVMTTVFLVANRISKPVQQLNQAALDIAAGNYEANIQVAGPKEIVELANTFNTMSECLVENISRLKESSLIRERMYGEYECAQLLQYYMLRKVIEDFRSPNLQIRLTSVNFSPMQKGILLHLDETPSGLNLLLVENLDSQFESLYQLNQLATKSLDELKKYSYIECQFRKNCSLLNYHLQNLFTPLVWSMKLQHFIKEDSLEISLHNQDMIFLCNSAVMNYFKKEENMQTWLTKILHHFAEDGLDTIHTMLTNELNFLAKRENLKENFQILNIQVRLPATLENS